MDPKACTAMSQTSSTTFFLLCVSLLIKDFSDCCTDSELVRGLNTASVYKSGMYSVFHTILHPWEHNLPGCIGNWTFKDLTMIIVNPILAHIGLSNWLEIPILSCSFLFKINNWFTISVIEY